jgi:hypothetical protein
VQTPAHRQYLCSKLCTSFEVGGIDCSRTQHDEPFGLLDAVLVGLGVAEGGNGDLVGLFDLVGGTVADEDGLATPLDDDLLKRC